MIRNRDKLEMIAKALLEYETLDGLQVAEIVRTGNVHAAPQTAAAVDPPMGAPAGTPLAGSSAQAGSAHAAGAWATPRAGTARA